MTEGKYRSGIRLPRTSSPAALSAVQVAKAYNFPMHATGKGYTAGIIELGGGFNEYQVDAWFQGEGLPTPTFTAVTVGSGVNKQDGPNGADGEVQLDMLVAGSIAPDAQYRVYFAANTDLGFLQALQQACQECDGVSISWGGPEDSWDPAMVANFEQAIKEARKNGRPVFVAAGDTGADDGEGHTVVDFPASAPDAIGCGGTRLTVTSQGSRDAETVWDDDPTTSATGGGTSKVFPGRDVPDIAGNADPDTGYEISVDGQSMVVGGTSAVAPLMLGLHALLWQINGGKPFDMMNLIVTNPQACFDVTSGDNGAFRAGPGRDEVTGFGVPDGQKLADALSAAGAVPAPPAPAPQPPVQPPAPTPGPNPMADFPVKTVQTWIHHPYNPSIAHAAARSLTAWAAEYGVTL